MDELEKICRQKGRLLAESLPKATRKAKGKAMLFFASIYKKHGLSTIIDTKRYKYEKVSDIKKTPQPEVEKPAKVNQKHRGKIPIAPMGKRNERAKKKSFHWYGN